MAKVKMCLTEAVALIQDKYGSVKTETLEGGECSYSNLPSVINKLINKCHYCHLATSGSTTQTAFPLVSSLEQIE